MSGHDAPRGGGRNPSGIATYWVAFSKGHVAAGAPRLGFFPTLIGFFGLLFVVQRLANSAWGLLDGMNADGLALSLAFGGRKTWGDASVVRKQTSATKNPCCSKAWQRVRYWIHALDSSHQVCVRSQ